MLNAANGFYVAMRFVAHKKQLYIFQVEKVVFVLFIYNLKSNNFVLFVVLFEAVVLFLLLHYTCPCMLKSSFILLMLMHKCSHYMVTETAVEIVQ